MNDNNFNQIDLPVQFCDDCVNLTPSEEEQDRMEIKEPHHCKHLNIILKHFGIHPYIPRPSDCKYGYIKKEE